MTRGGATAALLCALALAFAAPRHATALTEQPRSLPTTVADTESGLQPSAAAESRTASRLPYAVADTAAASGAEAATATATAAPHHPYGSTELEHTDTTLGFSADYRFTDKETDDEIGLVYFGARYYWPELGRWVSADPLFLQSPEKGLERPSQLNLHGYALNSPLVFVDADGLAPRGALNEMVSQTDDAARREQADMTSGVFWGTVEGGVQLLQLFNPANDRDVLGGRRLVEINQEGGNSKGYELGKNLSNVVAIATAAYGVVRGVGSVVKRLVRGGDDVAAIGVPALRQQYVDAVQGLSNRAAAMRQAGSSPEQIARALHAERNALKVHFRELSPPGAVRRFEQRNIERYGDRLGPGIEQLRGERKTWEQIIESATRPGGRDLGF